MFVLPKRNIILPSPDGSKTVRVRRGVLDTIPDWAAETAYFKALVAEGKIVVTTARDRDTQAAEEKKVKTRRGKEVTED